MFAAGTEFYRVAPAIPGINLNGVSLPNFRIFALENGRPADK